MFHVDWDCVEMMYFEALMRRGVLMVDFMMMIGFRFEWLGIMNYTGQRYRKHRTQNLIHKNAKRKIIHNWSEATE